MSYLLRLSRRVAASRSLISVAMPKGAVRRAPTYRSEEPVDEEEPVAPLRRDTAVRRSDPSIRNPNGLSRRSAPPTPGEPAATPGISRQGAGEPDEEIGRILRQADEEEEEVAMLRRTETSEEEEDLAPLRRQGDEEEEIATLRRQDIPEEEEDEAMRSSLPLSRGPDAALREEVPEVGPPEDVSEEAMPLRRNAEGEPATAVSVVPPALDSRFSSPDRAPFLSGGPDYGAPFAEPLDFSPAPASTQAAAPPQGDVIIEQLDVLIHEPAGPSAGRNSSPGLRNRSMRARYLRRL